MVWACYVMLLDFLKFSQELLDNTAVQALCDSNIIEYNNASDNHGSGIFIGGNDNTIRYNTVCNNRDGGPYYEDGIRPIITTTPEPRDAHTPAAHQKVT